MDSSNNRIGLALSGGGYRAAAYHLGTLRALHNLGILEKVDVISSVSGGSIAASYYLLNKDDFEKFNISFYNKLGRGVMHLAFLNVLVILLLFIGVGYLISPWLSLALVIPFLWFFCYRLFPLSKWISHQYQWLFFGKKTLSDLPEAPALVINATDVAQGSSFKFSKNRAWGYNYHDRQTNEDSFTGIDFPISKAVMASSCVPFAFTPIRMPEAYRKKKTSTCPLLVDGGLYDNQGVHVLGEKGDYAAKYIIVSNAGNTELSDKHIWNIIKMLIKTSDILMKRIEKLQSRHNMFFSNNKERRYAYCNLSYDNTDRLVKSYVFNIAQGYVPSEVYTLHGISEEEANGLRKSFEMTHGVDPQLHNAIVTKVKTIIDWDSLQSICPTPKEAQIARGVKTNLTGLSQKDRDVLIKYAEWMTTVQVRLYLPNLL